MRAKVLFFLMLAACMPQPPAPDPAEQARADYQALCAACHGPAGRGDGDLAASLTRAPPNLTQLAAGNGGVFPKTRVMSVIDGFLRNRHGAGGPMPEFGDALASPLVPWDDGSGRPVPVPQRLLELANYIETLQER